MNLLSLVEGKWQITKLYHRQEEELLYDMVTLDDGRLVLAINRDTDAQRPDDPTVQNTKQHSIRLFFERDFEENIEWREVILGYSDSEFIGMAVQHWYRLITWHADGTIKAWSLFP